MIGLTLEDYVNLLTRIFFFWSVRGREGPPRDPGGGRGGSLLDFYLIRSGKKQINLCGIALDLHLNTRVEWLKRTCRGCALISSSKPRIGL